jgi:hypothetical protein
MSDTIRRDRAEPRETDFPYAPRCCADAPHGHAPLYSYGLRDARLAVTSPRTRAAAASTPEVTP